MVLPAVAALAALEPLARAMDQLTNAIKEGYQFTGKAEKAITALGLSFEGGLKTMGPAVGKLRGTIEQQFTTGVMQIDAGLRGNTRAVAKLINQQMLTGTAYEATAKQFGTLQLFAGMQVEALNALATDVRVTGATYTISTDKIVKAVNTLKEQFVFLNVAGMGKSMTRAITKLQGVLGSAFDEGSMKQMMNLIVNTGTKGLATLTTLGIGDIRSRLEAAAGNVDLTFQILRDGIVTAGTQLKGFVGKSSVSFGAFTSQLDSGAKVLIPAMQRLTGEMKTNADVNLDFANTIKNMWAEVMNPIKRSLLKAQPLINKFAKVMSGFMQGLVSSLAAWFDAIKPSKLTFDSFLMGLTNVGINISSTFMTVGLTLKNIFLNALVPVLVVVTSKLYQFSIILKDFATNLVRNFWRLVGDPTGIGASYDAFMRGARARLQAIWGVMGEYDFEGRQRGPDLAGMGGTQDESSMHFLLRKIGVNLAAFDAASKDIPTQVEALANSLREVQRTIKGNSEAWRANNNYLFSIEDSVASINDKTLDPRATAAEYLSLTEHLLQTSINEILGIRGTNEFGLIVDRLDDLIIFEEDKAGTGGGNPIRGVAPLPQ
tara:strand:- start:13152 stop:14954 length:1803 start_codon:yes stop_codon:yes gene_type:complete